MARLRNRVRQVRESLGKSAAEVSEAANLSRTTIGYVEREEMVPSGTVMLRLAEALGTTVQDLFWSEPAEIEPVEAAAS